MNRTDELLDALNRSFDGPAWHGPALADVLADVTAEEAMYRPARHVHSIWEITLHAAAWIDEVASRLEGKTPDEPAAGDWPEPDNLDNDGWEDAVQQVFSARDRLLAAVRQQTEQDLDATTGTSSEVADSPVSRYGMVSGVIQHNAYHAGQISYLARLIRAVV